MISEAEYGSDVLRPNFYLGGLVPPLLNHEGPCWYFAGTLGRPWEQQEGHMAVWNRILSDLETVLGPRSEAPRIQVLFFLSDSFPDIY